MLRIISSGQGEAGCGGKPKLTRIVEGVVLPHDHDPQHGKDDHEQGQCAKRAEIGNGIENDRAVGQNQQGLQ